MNALKFRNNLQQLVAPSAHLGGPDATTDSTGVMEAQLNPWLESTLAGFNSGMRRVDNESVICVRNFTTQGVLAADKLHFALQQLTTLSHAMPKNFVAIVVMPNRAGDIRTTGVGCKSWTWLPKSTKMY